PMARQPAKPRQPATPAPSKAKPTARGKKAATPAAAKPATGRGTRTKPQPVTTAPAADVRAKFTLYNFLGEERAFDVVERKELDRPADLPEKSVAHSIIVVDRSGSMYSSMKPLRETLLKLLTLEEYHQFQMVVTLISYSSRGDVRCHFDRAPIQKIMEPNSAYQ